MVKKLLFVNFLALLCIPMALFAQVTISGKVTDASTGEELPGANILLVESGQGTATTIDGTYSIKNVQSGSYVLSVSYIGYKNKQMPITVGNSDMVIDVAVEPDFLGLDEVVVTAYGNQQKRAVTGATAQVSATTIEARPLASFQQGLQGVASGVSVSSSSGQPGSFASIQIRGAGSINASSQPLYVIDGVPIVPENFSSIAVTSDVTSAFDPNDIESLTILKDASAAALYGSRAANGVVLITTKKGKRGVTKIDFRASRGYASLATDQHEVLNASQYYKVFWQQAYDDAITGGATPADAATAANASTITLLGANPYNTANPLGADGVLNSGASLDYDTDWRGMTLGTGETNDIGLNVSGGTADTRYFISTSIFDQTGIVPNSNYSRASARINLDSKVNDIFDVSLKSTTSVSEQNDTPGAGGANNPIRFSNITPSIYSFYERDANNEIVKDADGNPLYNFNTPTVLDFHPVGLPKLDRYLVETIRSLTSIGLVTNLRDDLKINSNVALDLINVKDNQYYNRIHGNGVTVGGRSSQSYNRSVTLTTTNTLNYNKKFGDHTIDALVGHEYWSTHREFLFAEKVGFGTGLLTELDAGTTPTQASSSYSDKRIISYLSRLNYGLLNRYFVTASLRRDGSSVFGKDNKWGTFWSLGGSWIATDESFLKGQDFLNFLKFRASYGTLGNDNIGFYASRGLLGFGYNYNGLPGSTYEQLANPNLKWEVNTNIDLGFEFAMLNDRLSGEFVYYTRESSDLLFSRPIPVSTSGFGSITSNLANMTNSGIEFSLNYRVVNNRDMVWTIGANITTVENEITSLPVDFVQDGTKRYEVGYDRYQFYIQEYAGIDPANGLPLWYKDELDANDEKTGNRVTTSTYAEADRYHVGSSLPDFFGGFSTSLSYKGFDFSMIFSYSVGGKIYDNTEADLSHMGAIPGQNLSVASLDYWTPTNTNASYPVFGIGNNTNFTRTSTRFLHDGDYLRLKNVTFGYTIPSDWTSKLKIRSLRVYMSGENLLTFAAYKGLDPELPASGLSNNLYPPMRTFTTGINIGF